jgi:hypothetical protein
VNYMQFWKNVNESGLKELFENLSIFLYHFCSYLNTKLPMCFMYDHIMGKKMYVCNVPVLYLVWPVLCTHVTGSSHTSSP